MNKKGDIGDLVFIIMLFIFGLLIYMLIFGVPNVKKEFAVACKEECHKFDYTYYKVEDPGIFLRFNCWCLDNNVPKNLGNVDVPDVDK